MQKQYHKFKIEIDFLIQKHNHSISIIFADTVAVDEF